VDKKIGFGAQLKQALHKRPGKLVGPFYFRIRKMMATSLPDLGKRSCRGANLVAPVA